MGCDSRRYEENLVKTRRLAVLALLVALAGVGVWQGRDLWFWATTKPVYSRYTDEIDGKRVPSVWLARVHRCRKSDGRRPSLVSKVVWYEETGLKWIEKLGSSERDCTYWGIDGAVYAQRLAGDIRREPPWFWGVPHQAEPSAPWVAAGLSVDEWWARIPDDMKYPAPEK